MNVYSEKFPSYTAGRNALEHLGCIIAENTGVEKVLLVGGKTALSKTRDNIVESIAGAGIEVSDVVWYGGECTYGNMEDMVEEIEKYQVDLVIGAGGGKALDTAKGAACKAELPCVTVPTIAATCAATTGISIVYGDQGDFDSIFFLDEPPLHIIMDPEVIARAPVMYLRSGIGDTLAKYYEVQVNTAGQRLSHSTSMAVKLSELCVEPLLEYGEQAVIDVANGRTSDEVLQVMLNNIISTGFVSMLVGDDYNGSLAHGLCYGFSNLKKAEEENLHGEIVAFGILVLLMMEDRLDEIRKLARFYGHIDLPVRISDLGVRCDREYLDDVLNKAVEAPDTQKMPYTVTPGMIYEELMNLEEFIGKEIDPG